MSALALAACDNTIHDFDYLWADKVHANSPSGSYVAYVQDEKTSSSVIIAWQSGSAVAAQFHGTGLALKLQWRDPTTLEIHCPKDLSPIPGSDAREGEFVECHEENVRVLILQI
jgi:hypothetical protein